VVDCSRSYTSVAQSQVGTGASRVRCTMSMSVLSTVEGSGLRSGPNPISGSKVSPGFTARAKGSDKAGFVEDAQ
jgi:hypothetical protein